MRRELKEELAGYFEAPVPERKRAFVRQLEVPRINMYHVIAMQVKYISKPVWIFSGLFFCGAYILAKISEFQYVGLILGLIPFMVMNGRAGAFGTVFLKEHSVGKASDAGGWQFACAAYKLGAVSE